MTDGRLDKEQGTAKRRLRQYGKPIDKGETRMKTKLTWRFESAERRRMARKSALCGLLLLFCTIIMMIANAESYSDVKKGDTISFGHYEQDNDFREFEGTPINYVSSIYPLSSNIRSGGDLRTKDMLIQKNGFVRCQPSFVLRNGGKNYAY